VLGTLEAAVIGAGSSGKATAIRPTSASMMTVAASGSPHLRLSLVSISTSLYSIMADGQLSLMRRLELAGGAVLARQ